MSMTHGKYGNMGLDMEVNPYALIQFTDCEMKKLYRATKNVIYSEYFEGFLKHAFFKWSVVIDRTKNRLKKKTKRMHNESHINEAYVMDSTADVLGPVIEYLNTGDAKDLVPEDADFFLIPSPDYLFSIEYWRIQMSETWKRKFQEVPRVDKHLLTPELLETFYVTPTCEGRSFVSGARIFSSNKRLESELKEEERTGFDLIAKFSLDLRCYGGKLVLGGGSIVSTILNQKINDFDLFFVGCSQEEAMKIMEHAIGMLDASWGYMTKNCWTFKTRYHDYQFVFRLYQNIDEIFLGFDVDCSAVIYDGYNIILSDRSLYAFQNHVNVVDFTRMSPSYEYRLFKYFMRGFDIIVQNYDSKLALPAPRFSEILYRMDSFTGETNVYKVSKCVRMKRGKYSVDWRLEEIAVLKGLSLLIFMITNSSSKIHSRISDYGASEDREDVPLIWKSQHNNIGHVVYYTCAKPGRWVKQRMSYVGCTFESMINDVNKYEVPIVWKIRNPGEQISSTFHQTVYKDKNLWYKGMFYKA